MVKKKSAVVKKVTKKVVKKVVKKQTAAPPTVAPATTSIVAVPALRAATPERPYVFERILTPEEVRAEMAAREKELAKEYRDAARALKKYKDSLFTGQYGAVTGVGIQFRTKFGQIVSPLRYVIAIDVDCKLPDAELGAPTCQKLPTEFDAVPVKVLERRYRQSQADDPASLVMVRPVLGGAPISVVDNTDGWGTLGITWQLNDGSWFGLTNEHVTPQAKSPPGSPAKAVVIQPPKPEAGASARAIGEVDAAHNTQIVDAALIRNLVAVPVAAGVLGLPAGSTIRFATKLIRPRDTGRPLLKFGAKTGRLIQGFLQTDQRDVIIGGTTYRGMFLGKTTSGRFTESGDSGSVVLMEARAGAQTVLIAIGLAFGDVDGDGSLLVGCHMRDVLNVFGLRQKLSAADLIDAWT